jgi:hypothetical protein
MTRGGDKYDGKTKTLEYCLWKRLFHTEFERRMVSTIVPTKTAKELRLDLSSLWLWQRALVN